MDTQDHPYDFRQRDPDGNELYPLIRRLTRERRDWRKVSFCFADESTWHLLLVSRKGDAFIAVYFDTSHGREVDFFVSNGNVAALLMLLRLVQHFKV